MNAMAKDIASEAVSHWKYLAPVLTAPQSEVIMNTWLPFWMKSSTPGVRTRRPRWLDLQNVLESLSKRFGVPADVFIM